MIEGVTILDPAGWTLHIQNSTNVHINNVKIVTARPNGDGISIQSSKNVLVENSFVRTWDDSLVVKNVNNLPTENIRFSNNVIWTDLAQSMEVGYECYGEYMKDITFENITVLHNYHKPAMSIHNADNALISNVVFRNITIEDAQMIGDNPVESYDDFLIDLDIRFNAEWSKSGDRGIIRDVIFDNILVLEAKDDLNTRLSGFSAEKAVNNVLFSNINIAGKGIQNQEDINLGTNDYVSGVEFVYDDSKEVSGASIYQPYILNLTDNLVAETHISANLQKGILIPDFALKNVSPAYAGAEITDTFSLRATKGYSRTDWGESDLQENSQENYPVSNLFKKDDSLWISEDFSYQEGEFAAVTINLNGPKAIGSIRIYGESGSNLFRTQSIAIFGQGKRPDGELTNFLSKKAKTNYEFSGASGNYVDIKLIPDLLESIQIRFYAEKGIIYPEYAFASKIEFYPASLTYGKAVYASEHEDVYPASNLTDGNLNTYFESKKGVFPAFFAVDLGALKAVKFINLHLPALSSWPPRTQTIEIQYAVTGYGQNTVFETLIIAKEYLFDYASGNMISIEFDEPVLIWTVKLVFTSNSSQSGEAAQLSEINLY